MTRRVLLSEVSSRDALPLRALVGTRCVPIEADPDPGAAMCVVHGGSVDSLLAFGRTHPQVARVLLCGAGDGLATMGRGGVAHEVLVRPFSPATVRATLARAGEVHSLLRDPELSRLMDSLGALPALPATYQALCRVVAEPTSSIGDVADVVGRDVAVSSRVLAVVNSGLYSLPRKVNSVEQAVGLLGLTTVRYLVLAVEVFHALGDREASLDDLQKGAHARGSLARVLAPRHLSDAAYTSGLLWELGRMVLVARMSDAYGKVDEAVAEGLDRALAERRVFGVSSRELGARMLALWGLPGDIVSTVLDPASGAPIADLVRLAELFVQEAVHEKACDESLVLVTRGMLAPWGLERRADLARRLARTMVGNGVEPPARASHSAA